ncbi:MAG: sodium:calcium antiporter [Candidatus Eisenbacteria bacterium]|uniref:Sodium:calcium antiporter n=1 Tax=Eiseniibacteriota bacterium TaxID=2212470 RepID=A0A937X9W4_UNCEI|nr:sodium:calcium antiporter [Candidatus Eisenbacteria bacterium]
MEAWLEHIVAALPLWLLFGAVAILILTLSKGAELLVDQAVTLSLRWGVPKMLIGATIVSLGTTLPEASVSVFAAVQGRPGLALGNAVGSIICDTGLILGLAAVWKPLPLVRSVVTRQGWIQQGAGLAMILGCLPFASWRNPFVYGGLFDRWIGFLFLAALVLYLWLSIRWARKDAQSNGPDLEPLQGRAGATGVILRLAGGILLVIVSSWLLIPVVQQMALRLGVPDAVIAATLVAFGTSLPELVTAMTAVRKGHGELAVGNVIGADILNVLFVTGAAAAVTAGGLQAPASFFRLMFPAMLAVLIIFRVGIHFSGPTLRRPFGVLLLAVYAAITILSYGRWAQE